MFGQAAVMIFFLLSGFVVHYSSFARNPDISFREYFIRRFRRIYPLFVSALGLTYACACVKAHEVLPVRGYDLIGNLLLLQDSKKAGNWFTPYFHNAPLWSLSYEWFFYMAFFAVSVALRHRVAMQKYAVAGLGLAGSLLYALVPNPIAMFLMYFILWWSGVELAREFAESGRITTRRQIPSVVLISLLCVPWALTAFFERRAGHALSVYEHPVIELRHFLTTLAFLVSGLVWNNFGFRGLRALTKWGSRLAPISYALYVLHYPILTLLPDLQITPWITLDCVLWAFPLIVFVSYLLEVQLQPRLNRWLPATSRAVPPAALPDMSGT
jgi:peptidoglycan/LPS O-acetylase OafA/YrhL